MQELAGIKSKTNWTIMFSSLNMVTAPICPGLHVQKTIFHPTLPMGWTGPPAAVLRSWSRVFLAVAGAGLKIAAAQ